MFFWEHGADQLNPAEDSQKEKVCERVPRESHEAEEERVYDLQDRKIALMQEMTNPQEDSGAIRRHLHSGISVCSLVWEESSVCARISGIQLLLLLALVNSCQLRWPPCRGCGCIMMLT